MAGNRKLSATKRARRGRAPISPKVTKLVVQRSGNRCAYPGCNAELSAPGTDVSEPVVLGVLAHICGERPGAARFDASLSEAGRNGYANLIYLCGRCHTLVDGQPEEYTVERLVRMKASHEESVSTRLERAVADVGFPELEVVARSVMRGSTQTAHESLHVIDPAAKMALNGLTQASEHLIKMGMSRSRVVATYVGRMADVDPDFVEQLRAGFIREYDAQVRAGVRGDLLFATLVDFATQGSRDIARTGAGVAVLSYLFESCDLFERQSPNDTAVTKPMPT